MHLILLLLCASPAEELYPQLSPVYQQLHAHPELSGKEVKTSALLAEKVKKLGYEVSPRFGGQGFFAVKKHGEGPTLLIRTEMDALPVEEKTGLPFASTVKVDEGGQSVGVMHACGHDLHMSAWLGAATALAKDTTWKGTLILLAQPAEEMGDGAVAMIKDGVLQKMPKPDFAIAFHNHGNLPAGKVGLVKGYALAAVDTVDVTFYGKGGHGAYPHTTVDPIAIAAKAVLSWQTLISRENNPLDPAVLTVGSFHAGTRANIIPDEAKLSLTVRSYRPEVRQKLRDGIIRIANAEAEAAGAPKPPKVEISAGPQAVFNDVELANRLEQTLKSQLGADRVVETEKVMGAEDFGEFGVAGKFPSVMLWLGSVEPKKYDELKAKGQLPPSLHSATYAPDFERGFKTAVESYVVMVHELMR
ncbi:MAG: amidohydrolase [Myxococcaceae bacterium]